MSCFHCSGKQFFKITRPILLPKYDGTSHKRTVNKVQIQLTCCKDCNQIMFTSEQLSKYMDMFYKKSLMC